MLSSDIEIKNWKVSNLPSDPTSLDNAVIITRSLRFPIIIDPQELAYNWLTKNFSKLKSKEDVNQFKIIKCGEKQSIKTIEKAIEHGYQILYHDVSEKLDNNIDMLLIYKANSIGVETDDETAENEIRFNDRDIPFHQDFKIFITTKISNPN